MSSPGNSSCHQGTLPAISEDNLLHFVNFCKRDLNLRHDTIKLYLSGVRYHYIRCNNVDILANNLRLPYILRGIKKSQVNYQSVRLPITFPILFTLCKCLSAGMFSPFTDLMLTCIFTTAFYGFLRCGEFTVSSLSDNILLMTDVTVSEDLSFFTLLLRQSKNDPFSRGVAINVFDSHPLRPVTTMSAFLARRKASGAHPSSPLFVESEFSTAPLSRQTFITQLKNSLSYAGYSDAQFSGHSFRIGACTSGAAGGVEDHLLQVLGRWKSSCYTRYIRTHKSTLFKAQQLMNTLTF